LRGTDSITTLTTRPPANPPVAGAQLHNDMFSYEAGFALHTLGNIAQGLCFLHEADPPLLHTDLKSPNVLVDCNFVAKLADVALPRQRRRGPQGTRFWMAPECLLGEDNTAASDVYSYGVLIYECLTRRAPFDDDDSNDAHAIAAICAGERHMPVPLGCSFELITLMNECLHLNPAKRPHAREISRRVSGLDPLLVTSPAFTDSDSEVAVESTGGQRPKCQMNRRLSNSEEIMHSLFPRDVAAALLRGEKVPPEAKPMVSMYFRQACLLHCSLLLLCMFCAW
jgi:serine/threonine protein kinase